MNLTLHRNRGKYYHCSHKRNINKVWFLYMVYQSLSCTFWGWKARPSLAMCLPKSYHHTGDRRMFYRSSWPNLCWTESVFLLLFSRSSAPISSRTVTGSVTALLIIRLTSFKAIRPMLIFTSYSFWVASFCFFTAGCFPLKWLLSSSFFALKCENVILVVLLLEALPSTETKDCPHWWQKLALNVHSAPQLWQNIVKHQESKQAA